MKHYPSSANQCDKSEDVIPENLVGNPTCTVCDGSGHVLDHSRIERDRDCSKSKRGKEIFVYRRYYKQCPVCDPANQLPPLKDCPLCHGVNTNDHRCPYCDFYYNNWPKPEEKSIYSKDKNDYYKFIGTNNNSSMTKKGWLRYMGLEIITQCKPYKKKNPEEFQFHPLAIAYRKVLREIWSI